MSVYRYCSETYDFMLSLLFQSIFPDFVPYGNGRRFPLFPTCLEDFLTARFPDKEPRHVGNNTYYIGYRYLVEVFRLH